MKYIKKILILTLTIFFSLSTLVPQNVTAAAIAQNFVSMLEQQSLTQQTIAINSNCLSAGLIDEDISMFLMEYAKALRQTNPRFSDKQIEQL